MKQNFTIPQLPSDCLAPPPQFGPDKPWLAPLAGYSDLPFRLLCREYGAATCVTEMISAKGLFYASTATAKLLQSHKKDQPLVVQLFGGEPEIMANAINLLRNAGYRYFDCNLGCPVRKVMKQKAGAWLLGDTNRLLEIARAMIKAAHDQASPGLVGFKLRAGLEPARPVLPDLALRLEDLGADWLAVHPRFASQGYGGNADWDIIARLATRLNIPIIASGDLMEASKGCQCLAETGATGVMYARGALKNPSIFSNHHELLDGKRKSDFTIARLFAMIRKHIDLSREFGEKKRSFVKMRSLIPRYARVFPGAQDFRKEVCMCERWEDLEALLEGMQETLTRELGN